MGKLYTCEEVAARYGVQPRTVWEWIRSRKLPAINTGKLYRVAEEDLRAFEESRKTTNATAINM